MNNWPFNKYEHLVTWVFGKSPFQTNQAPMPSLSGCFVLICDRLQQQRFFDSDERQVRERIVWL